MLGLGRCLAALDRSVEARDALEDARSIFVDLAARPALEETETLLSSKSATGS